MDEQELVEFQEVLNKVPPKRKIVLLSLLAGKSDKEIAESLNIQKGTIRTHIRKLRHQFRSFLLYPMVEQDGLT